MLQNANTPNKSIVFVDEADELGPFLQTVLYKAVEEKRIYLDPVGSGKLPQAVPLANFTLLLATNHEHELVPPLLQRMKLILRFDWYSVSELTELLRQRARSLKWSINEEALSLIASRGRGTPRLAIRLMESCRRVARSRGEMDVLPIHVQKACDLDGLDHVNPPPPTAAANIREKQNSYH